MKLLRGLLLCMPLLAQAADPVTLRFSWWGSSDRHEVTQKALRLFEAKNPGIRVRGEASSFDNYEERLASSLTQGSEPDLMQINWSWISTYSRRGDGFFDLYRYRPQLRLDEYVNDTYKSGLSYGKLNGMPVSNTAYVFLWQKSTFDRAEIPPPRSWEQLLMAGAIFKSKLGDDYYLLDGEPRATFMLSHAYILQKTGKPFIYANQAKVALSREELMEWVHFHRQLYQEHVVAPHDSSKRQAGRALQQQPEWVAGHWAGSYTFDSTLRARTATLPKTTRIEIGDFLTMPGAKNSGMFGRPSMMLAVSKRSKYPEQTTRLLSFLLTDPEAARVLGSSRGAPLASSAYETIAGDRTAYEKKARDQIKSSRISFPSPLLESQPVYDLLVDIFVRVARNQISDQQAADRLLDEGNKILRQLSKQAS